VWEDSASPVLQRTKEKVNECLNHCMRVLDGGDIWQR